jgi:hypothetical protein
MTYKKEKSDLDKLSKANYNLSKVLKKPDNKKLMLTIKLIIVVIVPLFATYLALELVTSGRFSLFPRAAVNPSSLTAVPANINTTVGSTFQVTIHLLPNNNLVSGADVVLSYNPNYVQPQSITKATASPFQTFSSNINTANQTIEFMQIAYDGNQPATITGSTSVQLATITFQALQATPQTSNINFAYQQNATNDSNVTVISDDAVVDALVQPDPISVTITSGGTPTPTPTGAQPTSAPTPTGAAPTPTPGPSGTPGPSIDGDGNYDGRVNGIDYVIWLTNYGNPNPRGVREGDYNRDNRVNGIDYVVWLNNYTG